MFFRLLLPRAAALVLSSCSTPENLPAPVPDAANVIVRARSVEFPAWCASDGRLTVTESWYGSLEPGSTLCIQELRQFADPGERAIELFESKDRADMLLATVLCRATHPTTSTSGGAGAVASPMPSTPEMPRPTQAQVETRQQMDAATRPSADTGFMAHKKKMPGPYDPCHCGSGNKYKKCHMTADRAGSGTP